MVEIRLLGPMEVVAEGGEVVTPSASKERMLLAVLAMSKGVAVSPDRLVDAIWGTAPPANPANALQARVSALRKSLGRSQLIAHEPGGYVLDLDPDNIDAHRFSTLVSDARRRAETGAPNQALALLDEACALWRGGALADFAYEEFARPHIRRLDEVRLDAQEERLQMMAHYGRCEDAVAQTEVLLEAHPFREKLWAALMLALYRSGRQAEALRAFQKATRILGEELGIEPSEELRRLEEAVLLQDPELGGPRRIDRPSHNLPVRLTSLVGREREIERVIGLLDDNRAVTLVGPGGVGKTSLALACGHELVSRFPDGVWLADLSASESDQVPVELARSLDLDTGDRSTLDAVADHLRDQQVLMILDNCEHLLDAVADAATSLLQGASGLVLLATSREPLGIPGEILWPTRPLSIPDGKSGSSFAESDAVQLFADRASAVAPDFTLDDHGPMIGEICRRLDGLPLAVELAAARVRNLPVTEILHRLEDRFTILKGGGRTVVPRHQTLEATVAWSYDSLSDEERSLLDRLSVFSGGWSLNAAEAVGSDPDRVLDLLSSLVDRSLINVGQSADAARYSMLETIRAFASRKLAENGEQEQVMPEHARWFLKLAESAEFQGSSQSKWTSRLSAEHENLRAAIGYATRCGDFDTALRLGGALGWWWFFGNREEGRRILDELLSRTAKHPGVHRIPVLHARALLDFFGASSRTLQVAEEALVAANTLGDRSASAMSKVFVALGGVFGASVDRSLRSLDEAIVAFAEDGDRFAEGLARFQRMEVLGNRGSLRDAFEEGEVALRLFIAAEDPWAVSVTFGHLGRYGRLTGQLDKAGEAITPSIEMAQDRSLPHTLQYSLTDQAYVTYLHGDLEGALLLFEQALSIALSIGNRMGIGTIRNGTAEVLLAGGSIDDARRLHLQAAEQFADLELDKWWAYSLTRLGLVEECAENWLKAADCHSRAWEASSILPGSIGVTVSMEGLARVAAAEGELDRAAQLLYGAWELRQRGGLAPTPPEAEATEMTERIIRDAMSPDQLESLKSRVANRSTPEIASLAS